ncbi:signal transduction histidine kinase [Actinomadura pelletieri DSM 43383]|uniref:histidine kinase n=1 Tax=Actinomadura pelletieri DSM 43383 TaxID=1120940 RepID=A0A495QHS5_9ACTN|nr:nitrate- and nitrite sensing domain-containing protein [Actinomadura pelletieri]RKS71697.1 signal transduction histidine kinase [Actinomadura pelletieri DSM 43383]
MKVPRFSSIRARITVLVLVPLLALASLWVFLTGTTYGDANELIQSRKFQQETLLPMQRLVHGLQKERRLSMAELVGGRLAASGAMREQRRATDKAAADVRAGSADGDLRDALPAHTVRRVDALVRGLDTLQTIRRNVDQRTADRGQILRDYNTLIDTSFAVHGATAPGDGSITAHSRTLAEIGRAREFMAREDALLTGALAAGRVSTAERGMFAQLVGAQRMLFTDAATNLPDPDRTRYEGLVASARFVQLRELEDQVIRGAEPPGAAEPRKTRQAPGAGRAAAPAREAAPARARVEVIDPATWRSVFDTANADLYALEIKVLDDVTEHAREIAVDAFLRLGLTGGLGLVAIIVSALLAVRVSRRLLRECRTLASGVVAFTRERLPKLAEQIRAGRTPEPEPAPDVAYHIDEIRQIAESFDRAHEAVRLAAEGEVAARRGISEVFVNLARRNQALLHRQLSLLDTMERRTEDPSELSDLFRLDHLATRMRRHAEGLVILAGRTAGRGWRRPVPLVDVVRGAVAEVEDYPRVQVQPLPRVALLGSAVADVIHLLAEVVENATTFSPPQSPVRVSGQAVANGFAIEVEDRGLGMTEEAMRVANERLARPPEFDPSDTAQLGLFVVARLAERHSITVTLRPSPYGGTTAVALIPGTIVVENADEPPVRRATGPIQTVQDTAAASGGTQTGGIVRLVAEAPAEEAPENANGDAAGDVSEPEAPPPPATPLKKGELPKRRRQQHLAPQLRQRVDARLAAQRNAPPEPAGTMPLSAPVPADAAPAPEKDRAEEGGERSPETMRSMLSAMQRGWERGRQDAEGAEGAEGTEGTEGTKGAEAPAAPKPPAKRPRPSAKRARPPARKPKPQAAPKPGHQEGDTR